ncbi:ATP-dependent nuclease [Flavobacterium mekongense]|uniref:ATP-dependent nuclease n=1 Tax=Flavobacterium mekongense TaxID=3379707 RepID=UPI00399C3AE8
MGKHQDIIEIIDMKANGVFNNYIEYVRFPLFRNLESDTKISFDFPITFFIGKNGGGKSSTLQSLYGCPINYSLADYWFSTAIDPITDFGENRNCFIYGYKDGNKTVEVLKQRAPRHNKLDYWESSKPVKKYGMDVKKRYTPVQKNVEYIDFRSELSAFDSFMYFTPFYPSDSIKSKQDYIRRYSKKIKEAFDSKSELTHFGKIKNRTVKILSEREVEIISYILGKKYSKIEILDHAFFKNWGFSVRFSLYDFNYSEAYAGSGETAVIVLINKLYNCPNGSLILLDEPETSLHHGAQIRLLEYLLKLVKEKKIQCVISTHSASLIQNMPSKSIKVFSINNEGKFHVENEREPKEAFYELEISDTDNKNKIIVEDKLSKILLEFVLKKMGVDIFNSFSINYLPGGADSVKQRLTNYSEIKSGIKVIFDGDQKKVDNHIDLKKITPEEIDTIKKLEDLLFKQTNCRIKFNVDGNSGKGNDIQKIEQIKSYLNYYLENVFYLPKMIPEEIIWDDDFAEEKIKTLCPEVNLNSEIRKIKSGKDAKDWFKELTLLLYDDQNHISTLQSEFISIWYSKKNSDYTQIKELIDHIRRG